MLADSKKAPKLSAAECVALFVKADTAGKQAAAACTPTPMVVAQHANPLNDASPVTKSWYVPDGVCGFAWVKVRPANSSFGNWLKKNGKARLDYGGGLAISVRDYNQSMQLKEQYAAAFAKVLTEAGVYAFMESRMD